MMRRNSLRIAAGIAVLACLFASADAAVLTVGPGRMYAQPAGAAAAAKRGDIIQIYPGTYHGAVWSKPDLVIEGMGGGATITGAILKNKALFVIDGANITVKNLTFKGAKNGTGNGAGIRAESLGLAVANSRFVGNQNGILTYNNPLATLSVTGSSFDGNGSCTGSCAHAIYAGHIASLTVRNSTFTDTKAGHHIKSRAIATTITGNSIRDGANGTSSYLIDVPNGGVITITGNTLEKGPKSKNYSIAVSFGEEGATNAPGAMLVANNSFRNDGRPTVFVRNLTGYAGLLVTGNLLSGNKTRVLLGKGSVSGTKAATGTVTVAMNDARFAADDAPVPVDEPSTLAVFAAAVLALRRVRKAAL